MGALRNSAAHGDFDNLSPERAGLMEQQTNILLGVALAAERIWLFSRSVIFSAR